MSFLEPSQELEFTIYTKNGCDYCTRVKELLKEKNLKYVEIDCDDYLKEDKEKFLSFIQEKTQKSYRTFPMVFYRGTFIGGFQETNTYVASMLLSFDEIFNI